TFIRDIRNFRRFFFPLGYLTAMMGIASPIQAATPLSGDQSGTLSLTNSPYLVSGILHVPGGQTLTIEPGVILQFQNTNVALYIDGTLVARGSSANPILFTSDKVTKQPGQWGSLIFRSGANPTNTVLDGCLIEAGGSPAGS